MTARRGTGVVRFYQAPQPKSAIEGGGKGREAPFGSEILDKCVQHAPHDLYTGMLILVNTVWSAFFLDLSCLQSPWILGLGSIQRLTGSSFPIPIPNLTMRDSSSTDGMRRGALPTPAVRGSFTGFLDTPKSARRPTEQKVRNSSMDTEFGKNGTNNICGLRWSAFGVTSKAIRALRVALKFRHLMNQYLQRVPTTPLT